MLRLNTKTLGMDTFNPSSGESPQEVPPSTCSINSSAPTPDLNLARCSQDRPRRRIPSYIPLRMGLRNFSDVSTIIVGKAGHKTHSETTYLVHDELLTRASPFFAAALSRSFAEGIDRVVRLPEEKPEIFEWFLQWLYTGTLQTPAQPCQLQEAGRPIDHNNEPDNPSLTPKYAAALLASQKEHEQNSLHIDGDLCNLKGSPRYFLLIELYGLSNRLLTTHLNNEICSTIARLSERTNSVPTPSDTWLLYETIRSSSPLRSLILDLFVYKKTDRLLETHQDDWHPQFLRELCVKLKRPGPEALGRHSLVAWRPTSWADTRACEICREVCLPANCTFPGGVAALMPPGDLCVYCGKVFCATCLSLIVRGEGRGVPIDTSGCKPWDGKGLCERYHDHRDERME